MSEVKKVWSASGKSLYLSHPSEEIEMLENAIYSIGLDAFERIYLTKVNDEFTFDYKLYGLESKFIERVIKTYAATNGNLGILLNGLKGTGKTVTAKQIANQLNQPIILVDTPFKGLPTFLNSISQNITIFIDEYEKQYRDSSSMLTIMDGALNSEFRRVFLLTTNELHVERNMIERPSRVRYLKKFDNLTPEIVEEIVDDCLVHKQFKKDCVNFISSIETITVDTVKAILAEVNIHCEAPSAFADVFNVKKINGRYNLKLREKDGTLTEIANNISVYPRPTFSEGHVGYRFEIDGTTIGSITRIVNWTTVEVEPYEDGNGKNVGFDGPIILKVEDADAVNYTYAYSNFSDIQAPKKEISSFAKNIIKAIDAADEEGNEMPSVDVKISETFISSNSEGESAG
jgi:DNA-directed RNA polymerase subunit F